jgi:hypothetical protein
LNVEEAHMGSAKDRLLKCWSNIALVVAILLCVLPTRLGKTVFTTDPSASYLHRGIGVILAALFFLILVGFQFVMVLECSRAKNVRYQPLWLISLACLPLIPAFLYFWLIYSKSKR